LSDFVEIERGLGPDGRIALVRFDRGNGVNALSPEAIRQLTDVARSFEEDADTSVVILVGNAKAFSAQASRRSDNGEGWTDEITGSRPLRIRRVGGGDTEPTQG
jgi:enoyl-CoA hydratase